MRQTVVLCNSVKLPPKTSPIHLGPELYILISIPRFKLTAAILSQKSFAIMTDPRRECQMNAVSEKNQFANAFKCKKCGNKTSNHPLHHILSVKVDILGPGHKMNPWRTLTQESNEGYAQKVNFDELKTHNSAFREEHSMRATQMNNFWC